jgi:rRNA maturation endonuclease Nob1
MPMEILILIAIVLLLLGIFRRGKNHPTLFSRRCPSCRQHIAMRASACPFCGHDVKPERWIWERE